MTRHRQQKTFRFLLASFASIVLLGLSSCSQPYSQARHYNKVEDNHSIRSFQDSNSTVDTRQTTHAISTEEAHQTSASEATAKLKEATDNWLFGHGIGRTITNIGASIAFPPYALYLLGNAGLEIAGLPTLYVTDALPEKPRKDVLNIYNEVTSVPGRINAGITRNEFREPSVN